MSAEERNMTREAQAEAEQIVMAAVEHTPEGLDVHVDRLVAALSAAIHWQDADSISSYYELHRALSALRAGARKDVG